MACASNDVRAHQQQHRGSATCTDLEGERHAQSRPTFGDTGVTAMVPFLRQLSDHVDDATSSAVTAPGTAAAAGPGGGEPGVGGVGGPAAADGLERVRLDAERQILLTMLLAHMCSEHDATPRTFVEQVLRLYEARVLDSIQFLFDLGFVPRVPLTYRNLDRAAVVAAVRHQIDSGAKGDPLLLGAWPRGAAAAAAAAAGRDGGGGGGGVGKSTDEDKGGTATALGLRVLSSSRYLRDFEEEELLARGSFGDVYRTRHRLDGTRYAIKKVVFRGAGVSHPRAEAVMREVQCLAQLDHKNIVRYHTSWLESSWVENGMGLGQQGGRGAAARAPGGADGAEAGPMATTARALAAAGGGTAPTDENDLTRDGSLRARMDALVPVHMQSQLIKGFETMVRSGDSASESGSGWGWGAESDAGCGSAGAGKAPGTGPACRQSSFAKSGGLLRGSRGGDRRGSMSPQIQSPRSLLFPTGARERGFSRWSAEDLESETSKWSDASSCTGGDWDNDVIRCGGTGGVVEPSSVGWARGGAPARSSASRWVPPVVRKLRSEQFRNPSIDMDDLVSFGNSPCHTPTGLGVEDSHDENSDGWREWGGASSSDTLGGRGGHRRSATDGGRGRGAARRWARHNVSPDRLVQYPVTLYIQMNLCPRDTLQDWLRKRNTRMSSETLMACSGVLFEDGARASASRGEPTPLSRDEDSETVASADGRAPVPVLQDPSLLANCAGKTHDTPGSSPRTDPVTSTSSGASSGESSGVSDDVSQSSSTGGDCTSGDPSGGMRCPPPTREISREACRGNAKESFAATVEDRDGSAKPCNPGVSPSRSVTSENGGVCDGLSRPGSSRVDLHEALGLFRQLVEGVDHIHSKGIIHRDIKPENVFMGEDGCLKIGDFGLSRTEAAAADATASASIAGGTDPLLREAIVPRPARGEGHTTGVGTASYASPEQLQGRQYGVRSDLFSLGLVLLELCCCFTTTHERADAFQSIRHPDGAAPAHLTSRSPAIAQLAELLCRTVPEQRPSAAEVLERLDALGGSCGCDGCPGSAGLRRMGFNGRSGSAGDLEDVGDVRLREELAAKTRKVQEQEVLIGQLQRKLSELSRNPSPSAGPVNTRKGRDEKVLDMEALGLGLAALGSSPVVERSERTNTAATTDEQEVAAEFLP